jgi:predicted SAM-dependent methyltransferase/ADP-heptose:LPS heptosyltransferase
MTWTLETSCGYESEKIAAHVVHYVQHGPYLDLGCGARKVWPSAIGIDRFAVPNGADLVGDIADLSMFADEHFQAVFSSHALEDFDREKVPEVLDEWSRVLKVGGYLILYVPSANLYPTIGKEGANVAHKWDIYPGDIEKILREQVNVYDPIEDTVCHSGAEGDWTLIESQERGETNEYSLFIVARKEAPGHGWKEDVWQRNPDGKKRALVVRYGAALGDMVQTSSVLPGLREMGYHVTVNTTDSGRDTLKHDPNVDAWWMQNEDFVPNQMLGPYWKQLYTRYDHIVNLCESIEGGLLMLEDRLQHTYCKAARDRLYGDVNYLERYHDIAGLPQPYEFKSHVYLTDEEQDEAHKYVSQFGKPVIVWVLLGSSLHKASPHIQHVISWLLLKSPCEIVMLGDAKEGRTMGDNILEVLSKGEAKDEIHRVHNETGTFSRRKAMAIAMNANCVVGPETGIMNAVALLRMPKVIYLSHSSPNNLTKHWVNTTTLVPSLADAPCYPCHKLHYHWGTCHKDEKTGAALCAAGVSAEAIFMAIATAMGARRQDAPPLPSAAA